MKLSIELQRNIPRVKEYRYNNVRRCFSGCERYPVIELQKQAGLWCSRKGDPYSRLESSSSNAIRKRSKKMWKSREGWCLMDVKVFYRPRISFLIYFPEAHNCESWTSFGKHSWFLFSCSWIKRVHFQWAMIPTQQIVNQKRTSAYAYGSRWGVWESRKAFGDTSWFHSIVYESWLTLNTRK